MPNLYLLNNDGGRKGVIHALGKNYKARFKAILRYFLGLFVILAIIAGAIYACRDMLDPNTPGMYFMDLIVERDNKPPVAAANDYDTVVAAEEDAINYATALAYAADSEEVESDEEISDEIDGETGDDEVIAPEVPDLDVLPGEWVTDFVWDGKVKYVEYSNLPFGVTVANIDYVNGLQSAVGEYEVKVTLAGGEYDGRTYTIVMEIKNQINNVELHDTTVVYNGNAYELLISGSLPTGVELTYTYYFGSSVSDVLEENLLVDEEGNAYLPVNAGNYVVHAHMEGEGYFDVDLYAILTIERAVIDLTDIALADKVVDYNGKVHVLRVAGLLPEGVEVIYLYDGLYFNGTEYISYDGAANAGTYAVTATLYGDNYVTVNLEAELIINRIELAFTASWDQTEFVYNGFGYKWNGLIAPLSIYTPVVATVQHPIISGYSIYDELVEIAYSYNGNSTDAGNYVLTAVVSGNNYYNEVTNTVAYVINQFDLTEYFGIVDFGGRYDNKKHYVKAYLDVPVVNATSLCEDVIRDYLFNDSTPLTYTYSTFSNLNVNYTYPNGNVIPGEHAAKVILSGKNFKTLEKETVLTINKALFTDLKPIEYTTTYSGEEQGIDRYYLYSMYSNSTFRAADGSDMTLDFSNAKFTNAGEYTDLYVLITHQYYEDYKLPAIVTVKKGAYLGWDVNTNYLSAFQSLDGKVPYGPHVVFTSGCTGNAKHKDLDHNYVCETCGKQILSEGTTVTYVIDDKVIPGVNRVGVYEMRVVVSDANRESSRRMMFMIMPNPLWVLIFAVASTLVAFACAIVKFVSDRRKERISEKHFTDGTEINMRQLVEQQRNGIICESYTKTKDNNGSMILGDWRQKKIGRMYLTNKALEFYADDFTNNYRNFVIRLDDVLSVNHGGCFNHVVIVCSKSRIQKFRVPAGTAKAWSKEILHFKTLSQGRYLG